MRQAKTLRTHMVLWAVPVPPSTYIDNHDDIRVGFEAEIFVIRCLSSHQTNSVKARVVYV